MKDFEIIYNTYWNYVCAIVRKRLNNKQPEDIAQKVFHALLLQQKQPANIKNWLITVTTNECIDHARKMIRVDKYKRHVIYTCDTTTAQEENMRQYQQEQQYLLNQIMHEIDRLPPKSRRAFVLYYLHDHKCKDVARIMKINESTVANHIKYARDIIKSNFAVPIKALRS